MRQTTNPPVRAGLRRRLAVVVIAGLAVAGCADNGPSQPSPAPSPPPVTSALPAEPQAARRDWARSFCQTIQPLADRLGTAPPGDFGTIAAAWHAYIDYLGNARSAIQQAIDRLTGIGAAPVANGQQILDTMRNELIQLRTGFDDALARLNQANPNDAAATEQAFAAASNILGALSNRAKVSDNLTIDPQLQAAINQTPECQT